MQGTPKVALLSVFFPSLSMTIFFYTGKCYTKNRNDKTSRMTSELFNVRSSFYFISHSALFLLQLHTYYFFITTIIFYSFCLKKRLIKEFIVLKAIKFVSNYLPHPYHLCKSVQFSYNPTAI